MTLIIFTKKAVLNQALMDIKITTISLMEKETNTKFKYSD